MAPIRCCFDQTAVWHSDAARGPSTPSFNHPVGGHLHDRRHRQAERLGGLEIDHEFESCSLIDRQLSGLLALENPSYVASSSAIAISHIRSIAYQTACNRRCAGFISRRNRHLRRVRYQEIAAAVQERARPDQKCVSSGLSQAIESLINLTFVVRL